MANKSNTGDQPKLLGARSIPTTVRDFNANATRIGAGREGWFRLRQPEASVMTLSLDRLTQHHREVLAGVVCCSLT